MIKIKLTVGSTYCGYDEETIEYEYYGTEEEFNKDDRESTEILNMLMNSEFNHYFLSIDTEEISDEDEESEEE